MLFFCLFFFFHCAFLFPQLGVALMEESKLTWALCPSPCRDETTQVVKVTANLFLIFVAACFFISVSTGNLAYLHSICFS